MSHLVSTSCSLIYVVSTSWEVQLINVDFTAVE